MRYILRIIPLGMLLVLLLNLSGCGRTTGNSIDELEGQLLIWHNWNPGVEATELNTLINGFSLIHPNVTIVTEYVPAEELPTRYLDQTRAGLGPDVLVGIESIYIKEFADAGTLRPFSGSIVDTNTLNNDMVNALTMNDTLYALPFSAYTNVLFYNRALVDGQPPASVPALLRAAQAGHRVGIPTDFYNAAWGIGSFGGQLFNDEGQFSLNQNAGFADWLTWLSTAQREPNIILSNDIEQLRQEFEQGGLSYFIGSSYELPYFQALLGAEAVGVALLPPFGEEAAMPFLELETIAISRSSARADLGMELAAFLVNNTQQRRLAVSNLGRIPVSTGVGRVALRVDPLASELVQQRDNAVIVPLALVDSEDHLFQLGDAIYNQVLEGVLSPADAVARLSDELNKVTP
jgi:arabinogalactan oligomer / maltooligosaccharide transport system substrate-binding protein